MSNQQTKTSKGEGGFLIKSLSLLALVGVWWTASYICDDSQILPTPVEVLQTLIKEFKSGELIENLSATLLRVVFSFIVAMSLGLVIGIVMGRNKAINRWFDGWLIVLLNMPALVTFVLCYLWIGLTEAAAILGVALNKIPMVITMIREGTKALSPELDDMGRVFKLSKTKQLRHIVLPQLFPHIASTTRAGIALIWKIVLVVEFLGRSNGVGFQIHLGFQLFDITLVLAYALAFIMVMLAVEFLILQPFERRVNRWRKS